MAKKEAASPEPQPDHPEIVYNVVSQKGQRRNRKEPSTWFHSPGNMFPLKEGDRLLASIGINNQPVNQVDYLRVAWQKGSMTVFIHGTTKDDPDAIEVVRRAKRVNANMSDYFVTWGIALPVNTKSRFRMQRSVPDDPVYPAVKIDLASPIETKLIKSGKSSKNQSGQSTTGSATASGQAAGQPANQPAAQRNQRASQPANQPPSQQATQTAAQSPSRTTSQTAHKPASQTAAGQNEPGGQQHNPEG